MATSPPRPAPHATNILLPLLCTLHPQNLLLRVYPARLSSSPRSSKTNFRLWRCWLDQVILWFCPICLPEPRQHPMWVFWWSISWWKGLGGGIRSREWDLCPGAEEPTEDGKKVDGEQVKIGQDSIEGDGTKEWVRSEVEKGKAICDLFSISQF